MKTVNLYDFSSKKIKTIPAAELGPGFVRAVLGEGGGEVYVNAADALATRVGSYRHPPFPPKYRRVFDIFAGVFRDVFPRTSEEWENGFRRDLHPEREIELWCNMAEAFRVMTASKKLSIPWKQDCFDIILSVFTNGPELALETVELTAIPKDEARQIVRRLERGH